MKLTYKKILILLSICATILWIYLYSVKHRHPSFSDLILFITGLLVYWYSKEADELKKLQQDTNYLEYRPYLVLSLSSKSDKILQIKNIGKGIATAVHVENFLIVKEDVKSPISFKGIPAIGPEETVNLMQENDIAKNAKQQVVRSIKQGTFPVLEISYYDLADWIYRGKFRPRQDYDGGFSILGPQVRDRRIKTHES